MMNVEKYLRSKGFEFQLASRASSGMQAVMNCPFCGDDEQKFAISVETGAWRCFHENRCGRRGSWAQFKREMGDAPEVTSPGKRETYREIQSHAGSLPAEALRYLTETRRLSAETVREFRVGWRNNAIALPYFKDGKLVNIKYRAIDQKRMWQEEGAEPVLFNRDAIDEAATELLICEGELDAMSWREYGFDVVSVPSGVKDTRWIEHEWEWLERFHKIHLGFDMDAAGNEATTEVARRLGIWRTARIELPRKDANECLQAGIDRREISDAIMRARDFTVADIVSPADRLDDAWSLREDPSRHDGVPTGFERLDQILRGWRESELTIWTGQNASGKTTVLNQLVIRDVQANQRRAMITSLEMRLPRLLNWIIDMELAEPVTRFAAEALVDDLNGSLYFLDRNEAMGEDELLEAMEYAAMKYGVVTFVVDSLMRVRLNKSGKDTLEGQREFVDRLVGFAKQHRAHVHLVAHPRKGAVDDRAPQKVDVAGSGDISNLADNVLWMWRPSLKTRKRIFSGGAGEITNVLAVLKNREHGNEGWVLLHYEEGRRRFSERKRNDVMEEEKDD